MPEQIDCSIANVDITRNVMLVRIPKTPNVEQEQQISQLFSNLTMDDLSKRHANMDQQTRDHLQGVLFMFVQLIQKSRRTLIHYMFRNY